MIRSLLSRLSCFLFACGIWASPAGAAPPQVGETAIDFTLKTLDDRQIQLKTLNEKGPVVLVVLRGWPGYQCPICTVQVGDLVRHAKEFESRNANVVLVYPGPAEGLKAHAKEFSQGKSLPDNIFFVVDPDYTFTMKYDLRWNAPRETAYPSTFVFDSKGKISFAKISRSHGGRAKASEILNALGN